MCVCVCKCVEQGDVRNDFAQIFPTICVYMYTCTYLAVCSF